MPSKTQHQVPFDVSSAQPANSCYNTTSSGIWPTSTGLPQKGLSTKSAPENESRCGGNLDRNMLIINGATKGRSPWMH
ncbi:hypothetical protein VTL71DRAFT_1688 [Oculimacula yallundae]|uniref:Uncharacterized protein n=1 Tax=Oculimacula yallundae TaxID=86028 RepID=A0ABR4CDJ0_9HELO